MLHLIAIKDYYKRSRTTCRSLNELQTKSLAYWDILGLFSSQPRHKTVISTYVD